MKFGIKQKKNIKDFCILGVNKTYKNEMESSPKVYRKFFSLNYPAMMQMVQSMGDYLQ